ncbi:MAG: thiamine pyrophosphate-binding protein [Alphaproteobacteria bacterium]|nr:MAG: thiamine pyrophosphate-binding protein [Alphaproteobacteria bacterium]
MPVFRMRCDRGLDRIAIDGPACHHPRMNNADLIVATLKANGVKRGFGIPSGNVLPLMEAMRTGGVEFVLTAHEGSAGFAADVTGRMTGAPGFCLATLGPGATNLATGVGNAWLDRSPLIAITCNLNTDQLGRRIQMWIDHHALFKPITKATLRLERGAIAETLTHGIALALSEPKGPVHLDVPEDVAVAASNETVPPPAQAAGLAAPPPAALARASELIGAAKRPIAVLGSSAMRIADPQLLLRFVERHNLPFASTTMAKGMIDEDHPLSLGCIERACRQVQRKFVRSSDLIIGLGYDTVEVEYEAWIGDMPLLHIDIEPADIAPSVNLVHEVTGDLDASLAALAACAAACTAWSGASLAEHRKSFHAQLRPAAKSFTAHAAIDAVRQALPRDGILAFDVGAHTHQIASQWTAHAPKTFQITNGWSAMGFGLPGAIAAKLAHPQAPVVCLIGDGCFQMTCGEVATAKRLGLTLPVVVLDDRWLALIKVKQMRRQLPLYGTELQAEDYREPPAHYFGVPAVGVRDAEALARAVAQALAASGPTVIEAVVDSDHYMDTVYD